MELVICVYIGGVPFLVIAQESMEDSGSIGVLWVAKLYDGGCFVWVRFDDITVCGCQCENGKLCILCLFDVRVCEVVCIGDERE